MQIGDRVRVIGASGPLRHFGSGDMGKEGEIVDMGVLSPWGFGAATPQHYGGDHCVRLDDGTCHFRIGSFHSQYPQPPSGDTAVASWVWPERDLELVAHQHRTRQKNTLTTRTDERIIEG